MLLSLTIENFKAFDQRYRLPLAPITVIVGPNSSGKSSIIQSLLLLRQSLGDRRDKDNPINFEGPLVDLGSLHTISYGKNTKDPVKIGFSFRSPGGDFEKLEPIQAVRSVNLEIVEDEKGNGRVNPAILSAVTYNLDTQNSKWNFKLNRQPRSAARSRSVAALIENREIFAIVDPQSRESLRQYILQTLGDEFRGLRMDWNISASASGQQHRVVYELIENSLVAADGLLPTKFLPGERHLPTRFAKGDKESRSRPAELFSMYRTFGLRIDTFQRFANEIEWILGQLYYLGPLRTPPRRVSTVRPTRRSSVGPSGEFLAEIIFQYESASEDINEWFKEFGIDYNFELDRVGAADYGHLVSLKYLDKKTGVSVSTSDLGFGIGQLMPILVEGLISKNRTICVEQPEIHLHPNLQAVLADFFRANAIGRSESERNQWIIETHSEAMILRFLRFIAEGKLAPADIAFLYVLPPQASDKERIKGSRVRHLRVDEDGVFIDPWPDGFFSEVQKELYSIFSAKHKGSREWVGDKDAGKIQH